VPTAIGQGTFSTLTGDVTSTATGGATTVHGLAGVPFCTGFSPTSGQALQYTIASSPNPCYTAATSAPVGLPLSGGTLTGALNGTSASFSGTVAAATSVTSPNVNNTLEASSFSGSDQGAKLNAAIAYALTNNLPCHIALSTAGTISTAPDVLLGCTLDIYAPQTIATTWTVYHHGTSIDFHGYLMTGNTGSAPVFDIGKASALTVTPGTVNTSGSTVTWVSGATFSDVDLGDQITINGSTYNIATVNSSTSITTVGSVGTLTGVTYVVLMDPSNAIANNPTSAPPKLSNLSIAKGASFSGDVIRNTFTSDVVIDGLKTFGAVGMVYASRGAITAQLTGVTTAGQVSGVSLADYTFGGFASGSNANVFYGPSFNSSTSSTGTVISVQGTSSGNEFLGLHVEGNLNDAVILEGGGSDFYQFTDYERNGTGAGYEIAVGSSNNTFVGPSQLQSSNSYLMSFTPSSSGNTMRDLQPNVTGTGGVAYNFQTGSSGKVVNVKVIAGIIAPPPTGTEDSSNNYQVNNLDIVGIVNTPQVVYGGATSGSVTVTAPALAGVQNITWPAASGTVMLGGSTTLSLTNLDDSLTTWKPVCVVGGCAGGTPGGTNTPTATVQSIGNASPSLDGASMLLSLTTPVTSTQTNALWARNGASCDTCTDITSDFEVYIGSNGAAASSFEFDSYNFDKTDLLDFMFGTQCNQTNHLWQISNQSSGWTSTTLACSLSYSAWHHIIENFTRDAASSTACSGMPCEHFVSISIDGTVTTLGLTEPSTVLPGTYASVIANQFQIDVGATTSAQTVTMNLDEVNFSASPTTAEQGLPLTGGTLTGALNGTSASFSGTVAAASLTVGQGATPITSQSSANSQVVTCPTGGTTTKYCDAAGAWVPAIQIRAGTWSISATTSVAVTFATAMGVTPTNCSVTPSASTATTGQPFATALATTGFTVNVPTSGTIAGTYSCDVNNAN
jgi:hypothetical protein